MLRTISLRLQSARLPELTVAARDFYADRRSRLSLLIGAPLLCYGGGAVMFEVHYGIRRECGPAINAAWHWLLDSTIGFIALTPLLAVLLPAAAIMVNRRTGGALAVPRLGPHALLVGAGFALATAPGPFVHDKLASEHRPLARMATAFFGQDPAALAHNAHGLEHSMISEGLVQLAVGLPVYVTLLWLTVLLIRTLAGSRRSAGVTPATA
jgi:hypothetical protein